MRSLPHGHVAAALGMLRKLGLDDLLAQGQRQRARMVALVTALVVARLLDPASKLTTARLLDGTTATSSLGTVLALGRVDEQERQLRLKHTRSSEQTWIFGLAQITGRLGTANCELPDTCGEDQLWLQIFSLADVHRIW
jgi:hypothetical protein